MKPIKKTIISIFLFLVFFIYLNTTENKTLDSLNEPDIQNALETSKLMNDDWVCVEDAFKFQASNNEI